MSVLETDDADGIRTFRSVLDDGVASAEMRAPGVVDLRVATHAFFLLFVVEWQWPVCLATADADCYIIILRLEICD
jgi:hypothetical protein